MPSSLTATSGSAVKTLTPALSGSVADDDSTVRGGWSLFDPAGTRIAAYTSGFAADFLSR